jgi:hypothetical protein
MDFRRHQCRVRASIEVNDIGTAEAVKRVDTPGHARLCVHSSSSSGSLIHAAVGSYGGVVRRLPNRVGLAAYSPTKATGRVLVPLGSWTLMAGPR